MSNTGKVALITGVTGQDGSYLVEFLLTKGYVVHGIKRRSSSFNTQRIDHLYQDTHEDNQKFILHYGDLTDSMNLISIIEKVQPDEIYNLGAQSHVAVSFETPEYTANCDALGTLRILEAVRILGMKNKTRIYQASTSELFGKVQEIPQNENTLSIQEALMELLRCMPIGLPSTIENLMEYLLVMGFYSTTKVQEGEGLCYKKNYKRSFKNPLRLR